MQIKPIILASALMVASSGAVNACDRGVSFERVAAAACGMIGASQGKLGNLYGVYIGSRVGQAAHNGFHHYFDPAPSGVGPVFEPLPDWQLELGIDEGNETAELPPAPGVNFHTPNYDVRSFARGSGGSSGHSIAGIDFLMEQLARHRY